MASGNGTVPVDPLADPDPCALYQSLRKAYLRLIGGQQTYEFEYLGNGVQRRIRYSQGNLDNLVTEMIEARSKCEASLGLLPTGRRFAIQGGSRRPSFGVVE